MATYEIPNCDNNKADDVHGNEMVRREFLKRFGTYAAGSAVGLYVLMSPTTARKAMCASDGDLERK